MSDGPPISLEYQLDPGDAYLLGEFGEVGKVWGNPVGLQNVGLSSAGDLTTALVGFDATGTGGGKHFVGYNTIAIRPTDGHLVYSVFGSIYEWVCDYRCWTNNRLYRPGDRSREDVQLDSYGCGLDVHAELYFSPDGLLYHACQLVSNPEERLSTFYYESGDMFVPESYAVLTFHENQRVLVRNEISETESNVYLLVRSKDAGAGTDTLVKDLPQTALAARAIGGGFIVAVWPSDDPPALWEVRFDSTAMQIGTYPSPPRGVVFERPPVIDLDGHMYRDGLRDGEPVAFRFELDGDEVQNLQIADADVLLEKSLGFITGP